MPITSPDGIQYPDTATGFTPQATHWAALADSTQAAITGLRGASIAPVATLAARNALYPTPVQGNTVSRLDTGYIERYFSEYSSGGNPGGATPADWYPIAGALPFARVQRSNTAFTIPSGAYSNLSLTTYWTEQTRRNVAPFANGFTIPITGIYRVTATLAAFSGTSLLAGFAPGGLTVTTPPQMEGGNVSGALQNWCIPNCSMTKKYNAGDTVQLWALSGGAPGVWNTDSRGSTWSIEYIAPPVN